MGGFNGTENIPAAFILGTHGRAILEHIADSSLSATFSDQPVISPLAADTMTDFTSWGPEPGLNFKPTLTAPGGNIYSTVFANEYGGKSGTSMAAPHVAGAAALVIESFKKDNRHADYTPNDVKVALSNTSKVLINPDSETPYSVRHQGAGRIQVDKAVQTNVFVTDDKNEFGVALKEIKGKKATFKLNAKNISSEDVTYTLSGDVYHDATYEKDGVMYNNLTLEELVGASVTFNKNSITIPAKSSASVNVTVNLPDKLTQHQFVEGWVYFKADEASAAPDLVVPYFGFYGDWNTSPVVDPHWSESSSYYGISGLHYAVRSGETVSNIRLGYTRDKKYVEDGVGFNPKDKSQNHAQPILSLLRNAEKLDMNILDAKGKQLRSLSKANHLRKHSSTPFSAAYTSWDGTVNGKAVEDGQYYIQVVAQAYGVGKKTQEFKYPVKIDTVAPEVQATITQNNGAPELKVKGTDAGTGIWGYYAVVYDANAKHIGESWVNFEKANQEYVGSTSLPENAHYVEVVAWDHAGNMALANAGETLPFMLNSHTVNPLEGTVTFAWSSTDETTHVRFTTGDQEAVTVENNTSGKYTLPLTYGDHMVKLEALDQGGSVMTSFDVEVKGINLLSLLHDKTLNLFSNEATTFVELKYGVTSERVKKVMLSPMNEEVEIAAPGQYTYTYEVPKGTQAVTLQAFDGEDRLVGKQEVTINHKKQFDVRFDQEVYYAEDVDQLPIVLSAGEEVERVSFKVKNAEGEQVGEEFTTELNKASYTVDLDLTAFTEGKYTLVVEAYQGDQVLDTVTAPLHVFLTGVLGYADSPKYVRTNQDMVTIAWNYDQPDRIETEMDSLSLVINGEAVELELGATSTELDLSEYADGDVLNLSVVAYSGADQVGVLYFTMERDLSAPLWTFNKPEAFYQNKTKEVEIEAWTFDLDLDPTSVTLKVPGGEEVSVQPVRMGAAYYISKTLPVVDQGFNNLELKFSDTAGNEATTTVRLSLTIQLQR